MIINALATSSSKFNANCVSDNKMEKKALRDCLVVCMTILPCSTEQWAMSTLQPIIKIRIVR